MERNSDDEYVEVSSWSKLGDGDLIKQGDESEKSAKIWDTTEESSLDQIGMLHPLLNELILENIFRRLDTYDIVSCRAVCRKWCHIATPYFLSHLDEIQITFGDGTGGNNKEDKKNDAGFLFGLYDISNYISYLKSGSIRYTNFRFYEVDTISTIVREFFETTGSDIHILKLDFQNIDEHPHMYENTLWDDDVETETEDDLEELFELEFGAAGKLNPRPKLIEVNVLRNILLQYCPNLERLVIFSLPPYIKNSRLLEQAPTTSSQVTKIKRIKINHEYKTALYSQRFLINLFSICPELIELQLSTNWDSQQQDNKIVRSLTLSNRLNSLKSLSLSDVGYSTLALLTESKSQLKTVKFQQFHFGDESTIELFLKQQSACLESLILDSVADSDFILQPMIVNFPTMSKLHTLRMKNQPMNFANSFGPIDYVFNFPQLKRLEISGNAKDYQLDNIFANMDIQNSHVGVETLELPYALNNPELITKIGKLFPNVIHLTVAAQTDVTFQAMWDCWPKLQTLFICVVPEHNDWDEKLILGLDCLLTGIPRDICKQILKQRNYFDVDLSNIKLSSSISNFQKLERLTIHGGPKKFMLTGNRKRRNIITDMGVHFALLKLTSLKYLYIDGSVNKISDSCIATLTQKLDLHMNLRRKCVAVELMKYPDREYSRNSEIEPVGNCRIC